MTTTALRFRTARAALLAHVEFPELALYCLNDARIYDADHPWVLAPEGAYPSISLARRHPEGAPSAEAQQTAAGSCPFCDYEPCACAVLREKAALSNRLSEARAAELELRRANRELAEEVRRSTGARAVAERWERTAATVADHLRPCFTTHIGADNVVWAAEHVAEMLGIAREQAKNAEAEAVLSAAEAAALREALDGLVSRGDIARAHAVLADAHPRAQLIAARAERLEKLAPLLRAVVRWARGSAVRPRELLDAVEQAFNDGLLDGLGGEQR